MSFQQGAATTNQATGTPSTLAFSSNTKPGSLLVAVIQAYTGGSAPTGGFSISDTQNNNWVILPTTAGVTNPDDLYSAFAYALNSKGGADTISWGLGTGGTYVDIDIVIAEYSNVTSLRTSGSGNGTSTAGTTATTDSITPHIGDLLVAWMGSYAPSSTGSLASGGSYNLREVSSSGGANARATAIADFIATSASSQTATFSYATNTGTFYYSAGLVAFVSISGGGISTTQESAPIAVTVCNSKGQSIPITSPTLGGEIAAPVAICFCDPNGKEYTVTGGTLGAEVAAPIPVVLCDGNGKPIVPPIVFTSNGNSYTISSTLTGTKLGHPTPVRLVNSSGFLYVVAGGGFTLGTFVASETSIVLCDTTGHEILSVGLAT